MIFSLKVMPTSKSASMKCWRLTASSCSISSSSLGSLGVSKKLKKEVHFSVLVKVRVFPFFVCFFLNTFTVTFLPGFHLMVVPSDFSNTSSFSRMYVLVRMAFSKNSLGAKVNSRRKLKLSGIRTQRTSCKYWSTSSSFSPRRSFKVSLFWKTPSQNPGIPTSRFFFPCSSSPSFSSSSSPSLSSASSSPSTYPICPKKSFMLSTCSSVGSCLPMMMSFLLSKRGSNLASYFISSSRISFASSSSTASISS
mmetsp:Transcript_30469/g.78974  ORF Transcript_30469/g.78974 Transcript_30469/m.78974 type:complete len:251 (+) Transcript_30469:3443-4195(+)